MILRARLTAGLERWRRRCVDQAAVGLPAHATMLYPFVALERLGPAVRARLARVARRRSPIAHVLDGPRLWPDVVYLSLDPSEPFVELQRDLGRAFPDFPIYGPEFDLEFVPHVTIAEEGAECVPLGDPAWRSLPLAAVASAIEVIARPADGRWRTVWRIPLGGRAAPADR
ncbi:MAG TPA: 2'-5' RNA ligase family protein [Candidatus Limnocylindria bacterium]|nr:2'-5' RNA ligase family protein [Candidatus Limnocylindria bacterium]